MKERLLHPLWLQQPFAFLIVVRGGVVGYRIDAAGDLERFTEGVIGDGGGTHVAVHPSGTFLLTAQYGGGSTALFPIDPDGKLGVAARGGSGGPNITVNISTQDIGGFQRSRGQIAAHLARAVRRGQASL